MRALVGGRARASLPAPFPGFIPHQQPCFLTVALITLSLAIIHTNLFAFLGSVLVAGSNPNMDVTNDQNVKYPTEYRMEKFYPPYYNTRRPQPKGLRPSLSYGGSAFEVWLDRDDLFGNVTSVESATVVVIRPGFSTHSRVSWAHSLTSLHD
jgi:hypothetical protein